MILKFHCCRNALKTRRKCFNWLQVKESKWYWQFFSIIQKRDICFWCCTGAIEISVANKLMETYSHQFSNRQTSNSFMLLSPTTLNCPLISNRLTYIASDPIWHTVINKHGQKHCREPKKKASDIGTRCGSKCKGTITVYLQHDSGIIRFRCIYHSLIFSTFNAKY